MSATSLSSVTPTEPQINQYTGGTPGGAATTGTLAANVDYLDLGATGAGPGNTDATGITILVDSNLTSFDDSVWSDIRVWAENLPILDTAFDIEAEFGSAVTLPAVSLDAVLTAGVPLPGNPWDALLGTAAGAASVGTDEYDPATNLIRSIILQGQAGAAATAWNQAQSIQSAPILVVEFARVEDNGYSTLQGGIAMNPEWQEDNLFIFTDCDLYWATTFLGREVWQKVGEIKDESISVTANEEDVEWMRRKPKVTFHRARSTSTVSVSFTGDQVNPYIWALAHGVTPQVSTSRKTITYSQGANTTRRPTGKWILRYRTTGGYIVTMELPRATLMSDGEFTPGGDDFAGRSFTLTGLARAGCRGGRQMRVDISQQPIDRACVPITYTKDI